MAWALSSRNRSSNATPMNGSWNPIEILCFLILFILSTVVNSSASERRLVFYRVPNVLVSMQDQICNAVAPAKKKSTTGRLERIWVTGHTNPIPPSQSSIICRKKSRTLYVRGVGSVFLSRFFRFSVNEEKKWLQPSDLQHATRTE